MVSVPVSPYCEMARWTLDRLGLAYTEDRHAPFFHRWQARRHGGGAVVPVLDTGETALTDARQVVDYYERRVPEAQRLYPAEPEQHADARHLFNDFFDELGVAVRAWAYAYMLPLRASTVRTWIDGVPALERRVVPVAYPLLAVIVKRSLRLDPGTVAEQRQVIDASLTRVGERLGDGRRYLLGDRFTAADVAFASLLAPAVLPPQYKGPLPGFGELPIAMREEVRDITAHPAGQFALRLYREERELVAT